MATTRETALMTVAAIRTGNRKSTEVLFNERQAIFSLPGSKDSSGTLKMLRAAQRSKMPVKAAFDSKRAMLNRATAPSGREIEAFLRGRVLLKKPQKPLRINIEKFDPTTFNIVDLKLKWPVFNLCTRTIPSYAKAKEIFDFCAALSCHLPGPPAVSPCIPFQYVRDGCYARAHQMRRIITKRYGYCCEKVFSFANQDNDRLAVQAGKWGGCCVTWWYHVAPLVRVRIRLPLRRPLRPITLTLAMVIDPSMFDKPVLLSTWLQAQANTACSANAHVSMYSIQPGSAYWPANYSGTAFGTDDAYVQTESTLVNYRNLVTC